MFDCPADFVEPIARFRVMYNDVLPAEHQAAYRLRGIDPADMWSLQWSFDCPEAAASCLEGQIARAPSFRTYKLVDARPACMAEGFKAAHAGLDIDEAVKAFSRRDNEQGWFLEGYHLHARVDTGAGFLSLVHSIRTESGVGLPGCALIARSIQA